MLLAQDSEGGVSLSDVETWVTWVTWVTIRCDHTMIFVTMGCGSGRGQHSEGAPRLRTLGDILSKPSGRKIVGKSIGFLKEYLPMESGSTDQNP